MADSEKITINMSVVDLGQIDLLVEEGFYANRTDFIRTAIRNLLNNHDTTVRQTVLRRSFVLGTLHYSRKDLEKLQAEGAKLVIKVIGLLVLAQDISPELAKATIDTVQVFGVFRATEAVKDVLNNKFLTEKEISDVLK